MGAATSAGLLAIGAVWRLTGATAAGHALIRAATTGSETEQTLAKMLLVQAGNRSVPVVAGTLLSERAAAGLVDVLASIGTQEARESLVRLSNASAAVTPQCRAAAAEALRTLDEIRRRDDDRS